MEERREFHTTVCCAHPYFGFVSTPHALIDFSDRVPAEFGHRAIAAIDGDGFRNEGLPVHKPAGELWIGLFGGSVAFGVPATDNSTTIAGLLERRLNQPGGRRVRVVNLAIPGGQQPQQLLVLLLNRHRLDAAITFDGVNEVVVPTCYNKDHVPPQFPYRPYYELLFGHTITDEQVCESVLLERETAAFRRRPAWQQRLLAPLHARTTARHRARLAELSGAPAAFRSFFGDARGQSVEAVGTEGARSWAEYTAVMSSVCRSLGLPALFVVQPIPDRQKPLTTRERADLEAQAGIVAIRAKGYAEVLTRARALQDAGHPVVSFEDVFEGVTEPVYTDLIHFEDRGSALVAERLAEHIGRTWPIYQSG
jgi:hypothetical protein